MAKYATLVTSKGTIKVRLLPDHAPMTVDNFVGLATGTKEWKDPRDGKKKTEPMYDGTVFHRVIPEFMIQAGDPTGTGTGGPGYEFEDEVAGGPGFSKPGYLAMANAGPGTNGSQFFITEAPTTWLTGKHTIFGEVIEGMEVVNEIARVPRDKRDKPNDDVVIERVEISES
ncbi:MAG: peptidylprolyl isomerase [Actinobacteria bacterium]|nr:MAG: peptidylprolyl isomerase [Actinomycetota bacterium]